MPRHIFGANLGIQPQICDELSQGIAKFLRILSKMAQMTLKVKANDPYFQYQLRVYQDAYLVEIWWF